MSGASNTSIVDRTPQRVTILATHVQSRSSRLSLWVFPLRRASCVEPERINTHTHTHTHRFGVVARPTTSVMTQVESIKHPYPTETSGRDHRSERLKSEVEPPALVRSIIQPTPYETQSNGRYATSAIDVTLPVAGEPESLSYDRTIEIDTTAPVVLNATSTQHNGTYTTGAVIGVTVHFSSPVVVANGDYPDDCVGGEAGCEGLPALQLDASGEDGDKNAWYASGSGTADLVFEYEASQPRVILATPPSA